MSERAELEKELRARYMRKGMSEEAALAAFDFAWEEGHSSGNWEVEMYYTDIARVANLAFDAGWAGGQDQPITVFPNVTQLALSQISHAHVHGTGECIKRRAGKRCDAA